MTQCPIDKCSSQLKEGSKFCSYHDRKLAKAKKSFDPMPAKTEKQAAAERQYSIIAKAYKAANPECQAKLMGCTRWTEDVHHISGRLGSKLTDEKNFLAVCRHCHQTIENNPVFSKALGLSINRLSKTEQQ